MTSGSSLRLGLLRIMVMREDASRRSASERMTTSDIVACNPADDRATNAALCEHGSGRCNTHGKRSGERNPAKHLSLVQQSVLS